MEPKKFSELTEQQKADTRDAIRGYKVYTVLFNQILTGEPTLTVLENTIGEITLNKVSGGGGSFVYYDFVLSEGVFDVTKTFCHVENAYSISLGYSYVPKIANNNDRITISFSTTTVPTIATQKSFNGGDSNYYRVYIEIRVYL